MEVEYRKKKISKFDSLKPLLSLLEGLLLKGGLGQQVIMMIMIINDDDDDDDAGGGQRRHRHRGALRDSGLRLGQDSPVSVQSKKNIP